MSKLSGDIRSAFAHRSIPRIVTIYEDDPVDGADAEWFKGKAADDLTADDWRGRETALFFFTNEAFCYYLQSAMSVGVVEDGLAGTVLARLDRPKLSYWSDADAALFAMLTLDELNAMRDWLVELSSSGEYEDHLLSNVDRTMILTEARKREMPDCA